MADIKYTVTDSLPEEILGFEQYSESDKNLIESFQINNLFDPQKHFSEIHIYSTTNSLLESNSNYTGYKFLGNAQSAGKPGASVLSVDPVADSIAYGYPNGGIKLLYHFINDLFTAGKSTAEFFINGISEDRTELRLLASTLDNSAVEQTALLLAEDLKNQSYFDGFRLNFGNNDLFIGINIGTIDYNDQIAVTVKLYEPLPNTYDIGSTLNIVEIVSDSVSYEIETQSPAEEVKQLVLRSPNFNIDIQDNSIVPSEYLSYDDLFSYPVNNSNSQIFSVFNEKGIEISVDYNDYNDFIHFSSAQERLINFKYKLDLITSYSSSLASISGVSPILAGTSGSTSYYNGLIQGVVSNFDHYERFLYYESGSSSWPKTNNTKPYINAVSTTPAAQNWYTNQVSEATYFDNVNNNLLINTIPTYLRDDANNENYLTFIHMIGQHFDNLWLYGKAVSDKYNADNRLDFGISRDLVAEALKNFGIQLYTSNRSIQDLFTTIIGQPYQSGSEKITNYITGSYTGSNASIQPSSYDNYQKEVYKRIYHNLPLLLSSKGTERGLRALINCFGIPQDILQIKLYGGRNTDERPFYGDYQYYTSSLDKIRLNNTGSIVSGSTLSNYTSTVKRNSIYTDDLHPIEVGFSPTDNIDKFILDSGSIAISASIAAINVSRVSGSIAQQVAAYSASINQIVTDYSTRVLADGGSIEDLENLSDIVWGLAIPAPTFTSNATPLVYQFTTIDEFLGNPQNLYESDYSGLSTVVDYITRDLDAYNVQDYVRLIKFFDNTVFKMVKDFIPARAVADTGVIIKPHLLQRSKAKSVIATGSKPDYSGSIDTAFISGRSPNNFKSNGGEASTQYYDFPQTPTGIGIATSHLQNEAKYNGEVSGSLIPVSNVNLNNANIYKDLAYSASPYQVNFVSSSNEVCLLGTAPTPFYITSSTYQWNANQFFTFTNPNCIYSASNDLVPTTWTPIAFPRPFPLVQPVPSTPGYFKDFLIKATDKNVTVGPVCTTDIQVRFATCSIFLSTIGQQITNVVSQGLTGTVATNIASWFSNPNQQTLQYTASYSTSSAVDPIPNPTQYVFNQTEGTYVTITANDANLGGVCKLSTTVRVGICTLGKRPYGVSNSGAVPYNLEISRGFEFRYSKWQELLWGPGEPLTQINPLTGELLQINLNSPGAVYIENTIPNARFLEAIRRFTGIQEYFTLNGTLGSHLTMDSSLRYDIYELYNTYTPSDETKYKLLTVAKGINPATHPNTWGGGGLATPTGYTFLDTTDLGDPYLYGINNAFYPIVLITPEENMTYYPPGSQEGASPEFIDVPKGTLLRAYVIEAYRVGQELCRQQIVIYGDKETLRPAEGVGTQAQFTTKNILVNWDYNDLNPTVTFPDPGTNPAFGPWITTTVRRWGTTGIGTPP